MNDLVTNRISSYLPDEKKICSCELEYGLKIKNKFVPCDVVGGDLWGVTPISNNAVAIYLFDFLGHGESVGKDAAFLYSIMTDLFMPDLDPGKFMTELNRRFCNSPGFERYATMFLGIYNKERKILNFSSAAHQPFYHLSLDSDIPVNIIEPSLILGAKDGAQYKTRKIQIKNNELLLTYSDALPEARIQKNGELFDGKLQEIICDEHNDMKAEGQLSACKLYNKVLDKFDDYCESKTDDDLTFLVFQTI